MKRNDFYCDEVFSGKIKAEVVDESDRVLAFHHTKPSYNFHVVLVPRKHVVSLTDLDDLDIIQEVFRMASSIIQRFKLGETNYRIITNGGSFQDSKHLHFHLVSGNKRVQ